MIQKKKLVISVGGASGAIYAKVLFDTLVQLKDQWESVGLIFSDNAKLVWQEELGDTSYLDYGFKFYAANDFMAPFASGSAKYDTMIICPCSMGTLGRIASGVSNDLTTRAADVMLKERRKLILVARDTPYSLIHINNMQSQCIYQLNRLEINNKQIRVISLFFVADPWSSGNTLDYQSRGRRFDPPSHH